MNSYNRFQIAEQNLVDFERNFDRLSKDWKKLLKHQNLFSQDITDPFALVNAIEDLRNQTMRLKRYLDAQFQGGLKKFSPSQKHRSSYDHGRFGQLKGENKRLRKKIHDFLKEVNFIHDTVKSRNQNEWATITTATSEFISNEQDQANQFGTSMDISDPLVILIGLAAIFKKLYRKK